MDGWRFPGDWGVAAVDAVLDAVVAGDGLVEPCARLGAARGEAGVGLVEAFDDLWALFAVTRIDPCAWVVRSFSVAYVESMPAHTSCTESGHPLTGVAPVGYLRVRVGELYREARATSVPVHRRYGLLVVRVPPTPSGWPGIAQQLAIGRALCDTFDAGETVASAGPSTTVVLTRPGCPVVPDGLPDLLRSAAGSAVAVQALRPPVTLPGAHLLLDQLAEPLPVDRQGGGEP
ncbi:MAG: hypothetical protein ACRDMV_06800 [Streptosporangiales bacterium]